MTHDAPLPGLCLPSSHPASQRTAARSSGHQRLIATWKSEGSQRVHPEFLCALGWCKLRRYRELGVGHCAPLEAVVYHTLVKCLKAMRIPELVDYFSYYSRNLFIQQGWIIQKTIFTHGKCIKTHGLYFCQLESTQKSWGFVTCLLRRCAFVGLLVLPLASCRVLSSWCLWCAMWARCLAHFFLIVTSHPKESKVT